MSTEIAPALAELCRRVGVETGFWDVRGTWVAAQPDALCAVLRALGHAVERPDEVEPALAAQDRGVWAEFSPSVVVAFGARCASLGLRVPGSAGGEIEVVLHLEAGETRELRASMDQLPVSFAAEVDGVRLVERLLELPLLPTGYHRADVSLAGRRSETLVIQAPERCHSPPGSMCGFGLFAPIYALGGERAAEVGDLGDLAALARLTRERGGRVVGTLPLLATSYQEPFEPSPYSPVSRLFWNELYLDARALAAELGASAPQSSQVSPHTGAAALGPLVDYDRAYADQRRALDELSGRAWSQARTRGALEAELERRPRLDDYARFRAAAEQIGAPWGTWPAAARDGHLAAELAPEQARRFHVFVQWALDRQLAAIKASALEGHAAGLYLDLPVGSSPDGYDLWRERAVFAAGMSVGAPPDPLAWQGQNWALPPLSPQALRRQGYRYLIDCLRTHTEHASMLRVDHVMGLHRLFWVPDGMPAAAGVYVRYPADELWGVVALESVRNRCAVVGEDLGTVPEEVRPAMAARGVHRLFVAQFDWGRGDGGATPSKVPAGSIASLDTHDTSTFARFVEQEGLGDPANLLGPWLEALGEGEADLVLVALEDLLLEREAQNVPGTMSDEHPNWRRRLSRAASEVLDDPAVLSTLDTLVARRKIAAQLSGRPYP